MKQRDDKTIAMVQYILFAIFVVATPFVVVTKFLQGAVHEISHFSFRLLGHSIPIIAFSVILAFVAFLIWQRKNINSRRVFGGLFVIGMISISMYLQDLYGGMAVFDLQSNWHYITYGTYVFFFFRAHNLRHMPINKRVLYSYASAFLMSSFDELFQYFLSNRIFDVSDIAKDAWGCCMGLIVLFFVSETYGRIEFKRARIWKKRFVDYFKDPLTTLMIVWTFTFFMIIISPLITDHKYIILSFSLAAVTFAIVFAIIHFTQFKPFRIAILAVVIILVSALGVSFARNHNRNITYASYGLVVYAGLPVPFFDLLIYPNGMPRLVDKKHFFNNTDKNFLLDNKPDILLIGSGWSGLGGKGFAREEGTYMLFSNETVKAAQIVILKTPEAIKLFNRLREEGKKVLFVLHNTC
jgi:hypothetical protein